MKNFELLTPQTLERAIEILPHGRSATEREKVRILAGGQDLLTEMKEHLIAPEALVSLRALEGLEGVVLGDQGQVRIGALTKLVDLEEDAQLGASHAAIVEAAGSIASPQIRSRATAGGNLCQRPRCWYYRSEHTPCIKKGGAECFSYSGQNKYNAILGGGPSYIVHPSDLAPALIARDAEVTLQGPRGERRLSLERFFTLPSEGSILRENVLAADEVLTAIDVPAPEGGAARWRSTYIKFKERDSYDFAVGAVALAVALDGDTISDCRLVLGAVAPIPWRSLEGEDVLRGQSLDDETAIAAAEAALADAVALDHNGYKIPLTQGLIRKAVARLASV